MTGTSLDFNDLSRLHGSGAVLASVNAAQSVSTRQPAGDGPSPLAPPTMSPEGFPELLRAIVTVACASSEAHPVAVAANVIMMFCAAIGRNSYQRIGDAVIHARPFAMIVGKSSKARKGTSEITVRKIFKIADAVLRAQRGNADKQRVHEGGMSTGEGIAFAIRDAHEPDEKGKGGDEGVRDKRLLVIEPEFANVLAQVKRDGNTLSAVVRNLFDGRDIEPLTKTSQTKATRPHVVIGGHITGFELREKATENDAANGLLNRFLILYVYRPKLVPLPRATPDDVLQQLARQVAQAIDFACCSDPHADNQHEVTLTGEAEDFWCERYPEITRDRDGKGGNLLARSEMYARMLAMIFCLMDPRSQIEPCDMRAALAWLDYWHRSIVYIFECDDDDAELDEFTTAVLRVVSERPGISLSQVQEAWSRKRTAQVKKSLERLLNLAPPLIQCKRDDATGGRVALRYFPCAR